MKDACHDWKVANCKVVNGCTLLGLTEESDVAAWEAAMGMDPVHMTDGALGKMAGQLCEMAESSDSMFSGGKRALEDDEDRPSPVTHGRKPWVYGLNQGRGGRGGRGGQGGQRGGRGAARGGYPAGGYGARSRVATKWVSGYFAKYEIGRNKTFFSRNFGEIPRNSAEGFCQNFAYFREILLFISRNFAEFRGINSFMVSPNY